MTLLATNHDLLTAVDRPEDQGLRGLLRNVLAARDRWLPTVQYRTEERWYRRLALDEFGCGRDAEAWLLSWLPGQRTGLHDHGGAAGAFAVASGVLTERTVTAAHLGPRKLLETSYRAGQVRDFGAHHIHEIVNDSREPAVSVHLYAPALSAMTRYDWTEQGPVAVARALAGSDW